MVDVIKSAIVSHSAQEMLDLVNDVSRYPEFLNGCVKGVIHHRDGDQYEASLDMLIKGFQVSFTTSNQSFERAGELYLDMKLKEGPFKSLYGHWSFKPLGHLGCQVSLQLNYQVRSSFINHLFAKGFEKIAEHMVDDFVSRAGSIYA